MPIVSTAAAAAPDLTLLVTQEKWELLSRAVVLGLNLNVPNADTKTALFVAVQEEKQKYVELLLACGADANVITSEGTTPLMAAASQGNADLVRLLLWNDAKLNQVDSSKKTALMFASEENRSEVIRELITSGADVALRNDKEKSAVDLAMAKGFQDAVTLILESSSEVEKLAPEGDSLLKIAAMRNYDSVVNSLLSLGMTPDSADKQGNTALMAALVYRHSDIVETLLKSGADVNAKNEMGLTALHIMTNEDIYGEENANKSAQEIRDLISQGDLADFVDKDNLASFGHADFTETVKKLVDAGGDLESRDYQGRTPLLNAAASNRTSWVDTLISVGANVNAEDSQGNTAVSFARGHENSEMLEHLFKANAIPSLEDREDPLVLKSLENLKIDPKKYDHVVASKAPVTSPEEVAAKGPARNNIGQTPLMIASGLGNVSMVRSLLDGITDINAKDFQGDTALSLAAANGQEVVVKLLIAEGGRKLKADQRNAQGMTALFQAVLANGHGSVRLLLGAGADPNIKVKGVSAAMIAASKGFREVAIELVKAGADLTVKDYKGRTAQDYAKAFGQKDLAIALTPR